MQIPQSSIEQAIKTSAVNASPPIIAAYLFGSRATGHIWAENDVDVALLLSQSNTANRSEITNRFAKDLYQQLEGIEIDIVSLDRISTDFAYEILHTGRLAFCANQLERTQFEIQLFERYMDEASWRGISRCYLMGRVKERQMLKKGKHMINRRLVENLIGYVQDMLNRLQTTVWQKF